MELDRGDVEARKIEAEGFVTKFIKGWSTPELGTACGQMVGARSSSAAVVLVTGATGSLCAHLVQQFVEHSDVATVVCFDRASSMPIDKRQADAFSSRGIELSPSSRAKLRVLKADTFKPQLGVPRHKISGCRKTGLISSTMPDL